MTSDTLASLLPPGSHLAQLTRRDPSRSSRDYTPQSPAESPRSDTDESTGEDYVAFARGRIGLRPQMMIAFRQCTGEVTAFAYSLLTKIHSESPARVLTVTFGDTHIRIEGEHLTPLFHYLREHRVIEITEADRATQLASDSASIVTRILIITTETTS